jgi:hypothetical protein
MKVTAAILAVTAAPVLSSPAARADEFDFISALDNQGVTYNNILGMINVGKGICHTIRDGGTLASVDADLASRGWESATERGIIVIAAANHMCPDIWPALNAQVQPPVD